MVPILLLLLAAFSSAADNTGRSMVIEVGGQVPHTFDLAGLQGATHLNLRFTDPPEEKIFLLTGKATLDSLRITSSIDVKFSGCQFEVQQLELSIADGARLDPSHTVMFSIDSTSCLSIGQRLSGDKISLHNLGTLTMDPFACLGLEDEALLFSNSGRLLTAGNFYFYGSRFLQYDGSWSESPESFQLDNTKYGIHARHVVIADTAAIQIIGNLVIKCTVYESNEDYFPNSKVSVVSLSKLLVESPNPAAHPAKSRRHCILF